MVERFRDKVVIVTGAGKGMGRACALAFARESGSIVVADTNEADVNLKAAFLTCKYAIPEMRKRGGGAIVNTASVQAFASQRTVAAYSASKGAIVSLTTKTAQISFRRLFGAILRCSLLIWLTPPPRSGNIPK